MAEEALKIKIGADVVQVIQSLNQLEAEFKDLNTQIKNAVPGSTQFNNLSSQLEVVRIKINAVNSAAANAGSAGLNKLTKSTGQANTALVNFGRVVQDAPFGIIGIANNIDPLISSFQRLKSETGSTGGALKQLAAGLAGPAGIAIAISSITSLLVAFGPQIKNYVTGISEFQSGLDEVAKTSLETFKKSEIEFRKLSDTVNNSNVSYERQKDALNKINTELSNYGIKIADVATFQKNAAQIGVIYAQIKQEEAKSTALAALAAQEYAKQIRAERDAKIGTNKIKIGEDIINEGYLNSLKLALGLIIKTQGELKAFGTEKTIKKTTEDQKLYNSEIDKSNANILNLVNQLKSIPGVTEEFKTSTSKVKTLQEKINELLSDYKNTLQSINYEEQIRGINLSNQKLETNLDFLKRAADLVGFTGQAYKTIAKDTQDFVDAASKQKIVDVITAYQTALSELDIKQAVTGQDQLNARINAATDALIKLRTLGVSPANEEIIRLQNTLSKLQAEVGLREIRKRTEEITKTWEKFQLQIDKLNFNKTKEPLDVLKSKIDSIGNAITELKAKGLTDKDLGIQILSIQFEQLGKQFEKLKEQKEFFDNLQQIIEGGVTNAFTGLFEAVLNGKDAFEVLSNSVKALVADLIRVVIQMTVVKAIASALAPGVGGGAVFGRFGTPDFIRGDTLKRLMFFRAYG